MSDPIQRLSQVWSWIPAFRLVAELEHLPSAAERLHVTPSALSRSVQLLQHAVGAPLFERRGRNLQLNERGRVLLHEVRRSMRILDEAFERARSRSLTGTVRVMASGPFASLVVLPAIARLRQTHPELEPQVLPGGSARAREDLLDGTIDLALFEAPLPHPQLVIERLMSFTYGVYCGAGHPLYTRRHVTPEAVSAHGFAGPPDGQDDGWPVDVPRRVDVRLGQLRLGVELCAMGTCLAVIPDPIARAYAGPGALRRIPFDGFASAALHAVRRERLGASDRAEVVLDAIKAEATRVAAARSARATRRRRS